MDFELNLDITELKKRTKSSGLKKVNMLNKKDLNNFNLSINDKKVLKNLCLAGSVIEKIHYQLENEYNMEFRDFLTSEIKKGNEQARLTLVLFNAQKSMFSLDYNGNYVALVKNIPQKLNFYPNNLSEEEFHSILFSMISDNKIDEIKKILSQRTIVKRKGSILEGIDYIDAFKKDWLECANYLKSAIKYSDNKDFNKYLTAQIKAIENADNDLDAIADKYWANLVYSKFEFTITRECYDDKMTNSIYENEELLKNLNQLKIEIYPKDSIGARIGLINENGTKFLEKLKSLTQIAKDYMPLTEQYSNPKEKEKKISQTAVDVDIVGLVGDEGSFQAGIVIAQNLPNDDKPSLKIGGGRRNVYHRQIRSSINKKLVNAKITPSQVELYNPEADHWGVICHENTHSLGPKGKNLGKYSSIIEELKADMGMYAFLKEFEQHKLFSNLQIKQIIVTNLADSFYKAKPEITQAHRVRSVMLTNIMINSGAISFDKDNKLVFDFDKVIETSKLILKKVIEIQLSNNTNFAKKYVLDNFIWTEKQEKVAIIIRKLNKYLNGTLVQPIIQKYINNI